MTPIPIKNSSAAEQLIPILAVNLFCLPYAGGHTAVFKELGRCLCGVCLRGVDLPGHGRRVSERPLTSLEAMADDVFAQIEPALDVPFALYGHSLGATLACLLTRRLCQVARPPLALFVSGRQAPSVPDSTMRHRLTGPDFLREIESLGGCPPEVLQNRELMDFFEPVLRADFQAAETWVYAEAPPFSVPITVLHGADDSVDETRVRLWQRETTFPLEFIIMAGGHFFIFNHWPEIGEIISSRIASRLSAAI